jgi:hypothetical protein
MVAALFVAKGGSYYDLPGVDPWDVERDARQYRGPHPVVAHPPCERWGRYWGGGPSAKVKRKLGDDGGCFASALASVRRWGGLQQDSLTRPPSTSHRRACQPATPTTQVGCFCCAVNMQMTAREGAQGEGNGLREVVESHTARPRLGEQ